MNLWGHPSSRKMRTEEEKAKRINEAKLLYGKKFGKSNMMSLWRNFPVRVAHAKTRPGHMPQGHNGCMLCYNGLGMVGCMVAE